MAPSTGRPGRSCWRNAVGGCPTGEARITRGYRLPARHVIHTVGPVWRGGRANEEALLAGCYRASLRLAVAHGLGSIAFPAISTGRYRFPKPLACAIALAETRRCIGEDDGIERIIFCCFDQETLQLYRRELGPA